jgi:hypothetical protein
VDANRLEELFKRRGVGADGAEPSLKGLKRVARSGRPVQGRSQRDAGEEWALGAAST